MLVSEITDVCCGNHTRSIQVVCEQHEELSNVKASGYCVGLIETVL
jgi:hypothetical protein